MLRYLLNEAAQTASKFDPQLRRDYQRLQFRQGRGVAKIAIARKLAVRPFGRLRAVSEVEPLYWRLREAAQSAPPARTQGSPARPMVPLCGIE